MRTRKRQLGNGKRSARDGTGPVRDGNRSVWDVAGSVRDEKISEG